MSSIASIDTSQYTTTYAASFESLQPTGVRAYEEAQPQNAASVDEKEAPKVDLNNYYTNVPPPELNSDFRSQVSQAAQYLDNAITAAVVNGGMNPNDAVNIQKAKIAYEATISAANTASTFEFAVD